LPVIVNKSDQGVAEPLPAHTMFGDGKRIYPAAELWTLNGAEVTRDFSFTHPALQARVAAWQMTWRLVTNDDGETENGTGWCSTTR
jgi:hypothetical protein